MQVTWLSYERNYTPRNLAIRRLRTDKKSIAYSFYSSLKK